MFSFRDARRQSSRFNQKSRFQDALHRCSLRVISGRKERKEKKKKEEEKATTDVDTPRRDVPRRVFPRDTSFDIFFCVCFSVSRLRRSFFFFCIGCFSVDDSQRILFNTIKYYEREKDENRRCFFREGNKNGIRVKKN